MTIALRDYQANAVQAVRDAYRGGARAVLLVLPTGGGKTVVFSHVTGTTAERGRRVVILAHRVELIRQASNKLTDAGVQHGIIAPNFTPTPRDLVQVASVQTLARRLEDPRYAPPDLIVIDEAHHSVAGQWAKVTAAYPKARLLGVTATPERLDGRGLGTIAGGVFDAMVEGPSVGDLTKMGFLSPARVFAPADGPDLSGVRTRGGDYDAAALAGAMGGMRVVGDAVEHYAKHCPGQPAILFSPSVAHAETMAAAFRAAGWRAVAASGASPPAERDAAIKGLGTGTVQVLCSCDLISEGLDVPAVGAVILMRPTKSLGLYLQQVGRGLRPAPGKDHLTVLDHAGNTLAHGLIADAREWSLEGRKKRPANPGIRQCKQCLAIFSGPKCTECGWSTPAGAGTPREIEHVAGELREIDAPPVTVDTARLNHLRTAKLSDLILQAAGRAKDLHEIAKARGFKRGWAWHQQERWRAAHAPARTVAAPVPPPAPALPAASHGEDFSEIDRWMQGAA
ncbi:DEAD/DEAH box helicase [Roseomonas xinghualingensis]|uniref:DEAD/DEAH box helicase n=1 Tax=Roseomonas xinghualingensis TaxID=2986475 RepID=UPI0021F205E1|nr:DEAD/DEAH box helicase [Roseomonas sp. SXEYE001]MCV4209873.1 DEAD/DEAH box helicase [Roseomonas sp. SXEYE001]